MSLPSATPGRGGCSTGRFTCHRPRPIVATLRGLEFSGRLFDTPELRVVVITIGACTELMITPVADRPWITMVTMPTAADLPYAFRELGNMGVSRISCIGGRTPAPQLIDAALIQDLYLTTSAKTGGEQGTPMYPSFCGSFSFRIHVRRLGSRLRRSSLCTATLGRSSIQSGSAQSCSSAGHARLARRSHQPGNMSPYQRVLRFIS